MRPELHIAMGQALALGPDHCSPGLFAGAVPAIVAGLKAYDSTIAQARHAALESTFPRTRRMVGEKRFAALADRHLVCGDVLRRSLDSIGRGFPNLLAGSAQFLARIEWAWLEAYGAPDARSLVFADLAGLKPASIVALRVERHPALRLVSNERGAGPVNFDGTAVGGLVALVTRMDDEVKVAEVGAGVVRLVRLLEGRTRLGDLLALDSDAATLLLKAGALAAVAKADR